MSIPGSGPGIRGFWGADSLNDLPDHVKGLTITGAGALLISPDTLLVRLIAIDPWSMIFWRGVLVAVSLGAYLAFRHGRGAAAQFRAAGATGLPIVLLLTATSILFIVALAHTSVANTLIIVSASPLFAALFSRAFLGEVVAPRTWGAIFGTVCGIAVLVSGDTGGGALPSGLWGDLAALATAVCMAASLALIRSSRAAGAIPALALSSALSALVALPLATSLALAPPQAGLMALLGLVILPVAAGLTILGPRYLPAPEVGLIMLLETVLGPYWVWLALDETPSDSALLGGAIVIAVLVLHSVLALRAQRRTLKP